MATEATQPSLEGGMPQSARKRRRTDACHDDVGVVPVIHFKGNNSDPTQDPNVDKFLDTYSVYKVAHLPNILAGTDPKKKHFSAKDINNLFRGLAADDRDSWCVENGGHDDEVALSPEEFLDTDKVMLLSSTRGYCSFLLQNDTAQLSETLSRLPLSELPGVDCTYGPCLWFFFGRTNDGGDLQGRPDHTDSVSHDGTWHYQLSGTKRWYLRPTNELLESIPEAELSRASTFCVECQQGDVLVVNTRLWWHRTVIPAQATPSVSYARDFYMHSSAADEEDHADPPSMSNVDGLYAANDIEEGTLLFTEEDMPECELYRSSTNANCEVVGFEDGTSAVVSTRSIVAGEFFCVAESEEEESDDDECIVVPNRANEM